jgi:hypothetical protein
MLLVCDADRAGKLDWRYRGGVRNLLVGVH